MDWQYTFNDGIALQLAVAGGYALTVLALKQVMKTRKLGPDTRKTLSKIIYLHNVLLCLASATMGIIFVYETWADGRYNSWEDAACRVTPNRGLYGLTSYFFLWSKVWEFADTIFLCLLNKPVIFLHFWHHMTTFTMSAVVVNFPVGGFSHINCWIHTLMYFHFAHPTSFFRPIMTSLQIIQFLIVIPIHTYTLLSGCHPSAQVYFWEWLYDEFVVVSYLILFINFYLQQYVKPKSHKKE
jgi:hypothetical protein